MGCSLAAVAVLFGLSARVEVMMMNITDYSIRRLRRLRQRLWSWHHLVSTWVAGYYSACITLTYAPDERWHRRDISRFIAALRAYYRRRGWRFIYFWVAELQARGAVHYHLIVFIPRSHKLPFPDRRWWRKGITNICAVRRFAKYLAKYLQKGSELRFPKGLRLFGYGGLTWLERAMWRCRWLPRSWWDLIYEFVQGVFYVTRLKGRLVEVLTPDGDVFVFQFERVLEYRVGAVGYASAPYSARLEGFCAGRRPTAPPAQ